MRVAIVGGGVSGLVAAHLLHREHVITLFEARDRVGGHTNTVEVPTANGTVAVDTGFIVFNDRNYPNFERLLRTLRVDWQDSEMSFGVSDEAGRFEYASTSPAGLYATRAHLVDPRFHRLVLDVLRFQRTAPRLLEGDEDPSLGEWLEEQRFTPMFIERVIVPQAAAVWSSEPAHMWSFPARFLVEFFANHGMLGLRNRPRWRTVRGGSQRYVDALIAPWCDRIRLATPVEGIARDEDGVTVTTRGRGSERFDRVVVAAHADQALQMLVDATSAEREILGAFPFQHNEAVLHTDRRLLPRRPRARASWNYHLLEEPGSRSTVTYDMNRLQRLDTDLQFCVTLNRTDAIDPAQVIERIDCAHPVITREGVAAQRRHAEISGVRNTHYCGAYWRWGFHEDGVVSALRVASELGIGGP
jgi:predicted NAD/FAD-binding protein